LPFLSFLQIDRESCRTFSLSFFSLFLFLLFFPYYYKIQTPFIDGVLFLLFLLQQEQQKPFFPFHSFVCSNSLRKADKEKGKKAMSGLYNPNFSPARAASPQIRTNPDVDRYASKELLL
jgi:hypothetical protein